MHEMHRKEEGKQPQSPYHAQSSPNTSNAQPSNTSPPDQSASQQSQSQQPQQQQPQQSQQGTIQTMRLRQDPPSVTQSQSRPRKRKTPPSTEALQPVPPPPPPSAMQHTLPPAHTLVPPPHLSGHVIPHGYQYPPGDYPAGLPPHTLAPPPTDSVQDRPQNQTSNGTTTASAGTTRTLSQSKRAEQNRKAQRAFRERRDQHVKALESRSQLLDAALASADEANRRWEECRALVDQLRIENAALRAALSQAQMLGSGGSSVPSDENKPASARLAEGIKSGDQPKE